jgi:hypothetical protein
MSFVEETAWQIARFSNVYVNLESTATFAYTRPIAFERILAGLLMSPRLVDKILWGTGAKVAHPRPHTEIFAREFKFSDDLVDRGKVPQITEADKRKILAENYARMNGIDLAARLDGIKADEFAKQRAAGEFPRRPYSTSASAHLAS